MRGVGRSVAGALALLLVPTVAAAQSVDLRDRLESGERQRAATERALEENAVDTGDTRAQLAAADRELDAELAELALLDEALADARAELTASRDAANEARGRLGEVTDELAEVEGELDIRQDQLERRVRAAFKYGQMSFAEAFTGVRDIVDLLTSSAYVGRVMEGDRELVEDVEALLDVGEARRREAASLRADAERQAERGEWAAEAVARASERQADQTDRVRQRREQRERTLEALGEDRGALEDHLDGIEEESQRISGQLAQIAREQRQEAARVAAAQAAEQAVRAARPNTALGPEHEPVRGGDGGAVSAPVAGGWTRPTGGGVTSPFGPRWGRDHNGIDLAGGVGSSVVAARGGVVVHVTSGCHPTGSFGCGGGFGNYLAVAHDGGMATISAHLSSIDVAEGERVRAGQRLGAMGSSGNSYGSHLHFEVHDAGSPRDPCGYIAC